MAELRYVDWDGLVYYDGKVKQYIDDKIEDCLKVGGIVTAETLPSPSFRNLNYIYKITDEFTADENFEASLRGYIYDPGTWVQVTDINHVYLYTIFMEANASASDYEKLEEAITAIQAELTRLDSGLNETSRRVASLDQSIGETAVKVSELESSLTILNDKVDSKADIDTVQTHYETNELKFNNLTSQVSANTSSISTLSASVLSSQTTLSNLDNRLDSIEPEVEKIKGFENEINSLDDRIETIDDNVSTLINSSSTIITKVEALEDKVSDNETAIETLTTSANELEERVEALESRPELDLSQFALKSEIPTVPTNISEFNNDAGYLTEHQSLEGYAKVTDIPDVSTYITMDQVTAEGYLKEIPIEYITNSELEQKGYLTSEALNDKADKEHTHNINSIEGYIPTDLTGYATEEFVTKKIAEAELADKEADLEAYYTKSETEAKIKEAVDAIDIPDVSNLATKEELETIQNVAGSNSVKLFAIESDLVDIDNQLENISTTYATKEEVATVEAKVDAIVIPEVPTKVSELDNDIGYITAADLTDREVYTLNISGYTANQSVTPEQDLILSKLYDEQPHDTTRTPVVVTYAKDTQLDDNWRFITSVTTSPFTGMYDKYLTLYSSTELYKGDTTNTFTKCVYKFARNSYSTAWFLVNSEKLKLENVATEQFVKDSIDAINIPETDLSNYYDKTEVDSLIEGIEIPTVPTNVSAFTNDANYITESTLVGYIKEDTLNTTLSNYYTKEEITEQIPTATSHLSNDSGFVTSKDVEDLIANQPAGTDEATVKQIVESYSYVNEESLGNALEEASSSIMSKVEEKNYLVESDLNGYAKTEAIPTIPANVSAFVNDANYLTEVPEGYVKEETLSNYYNKTEIDNLIPSTEGFITEIPEEYVTEDELQEAIAGINIPDISLDGYATQEWVKDQGYLTTHQDLSGKADVEHTHEEYALKTELPDITGFIKEIPEEYITETELNDYGFITDVSDKADKDHKHTLADITDYEAPVIPDVSEFVTAEEVETAIADKQDKLVSGTNIATINGKSLLDGGNIEITGGTISNPDDIILNFTDPTVNTIGGLTAGTVITNWSLTKLIQTMLFGQPSTPDEPEYETPEEKIIAEEIPMYNMDADGNLIEIPFVLRTLDETAAAAGPVDLDGTEDGFYQITDSNGEVVESGYQTTSCTGAESPYILALPKDINITDGKVEYWDLLNNTWYSDPDYKFSTDLSMLVDYEIMSQEDVNQLVAQYDALGYNVWIQNEPEEPPTGKVFRFII